MLASMEWEKEQGIEALFVLMRILLQSVMIKKKKRQNQNTKLLNDSSLVFTGLLSGLSVKSFHVLCVHVWVFLRYSCGLNSCEICLKCLLGNSLSRFSQVHLTGKRPQHNLRVCWRYFISFMSSECLFNSGGNWRVLQEKGMSGVTS